MKTLFYLGLISLAFTGCVSRMFSPQLPESHPANPKAPQAAYSTNLFLMSDTNLVVRTTASTNVLEQSHEGHPAAKPESKNVEKKHEHK